ncbi:MAG TPA: glutamate synthase large subunit [Nitrospiria bacterium]|nr:glutamate synthase large subunit [Nitrospiria bacterium]
MDSTNVKYPSNFPPPQGLYHPDQEKDSCGIGFAVNIKGNPSHDIVLKGLEILKNLSHRGAVGCDPDTGDGAGLLAQIPHIFFNEVLEKKGLALPNPGSYGLGMAFLPVQSTERAECERIIEEMIRGEGQKFIGWREVPVHPAKIGRMARESAPVIKQFFVEIQGILPEQFEHQLYLIRKQIENQIYGWIKGDFYISSLSSRTVVYKGLLTPEQIPLFYEDLTDSRFKSALALVHSRFSTNTFPAWSLAHPYRYVCHNGEINTLKGNVNWMKAREGRMSSDAFGESINKLFPIIREGQSDSACFDNMLEFLVMGGRSLPHAMMMLIPEAWAGNPDMDMDRRGFYEYHASMMEPWDGPAAMAFTDGTLIGATLDRNGLRPARYLVTKDDLVILASEAGVLPIRPEEIVAKGRLQPGKMFLVDTARGRIIDDEEIKRDMAGRKPYRQWVAANRISIDELPEPINVYQPDPESIKKRQKLFGYTLEDLKILMAPMAITGEEAIGSMGTDTPLAVLSDRPQLLFNYFKQLFAQVTNPPIDPIREQLVMSLATSIGPKQNLLGETPEHCRRIKVSQPILTNSDLEKIRSIADGHFKSQTLKILFPASDGPQGLARALALVCEQATQAIRSGYNFIILSDRGVNAEWAPIPGLLAVSAVHHHLINECLRTEVGLIIETGEAREVAHFALLLGYGAGTINPYLAFETLTDMVRSGLFPEAVDAQTAEAKYIKAINKGLLKIFSKMGISTVQSYCGAQIFEAIGLNSVFLDRYFSGTPARAEGIGIEEIGRETLSRHLAAYQDTGSSADSLDVGGNYHYRIQGEYHHWNPETIVKLQEATRNKNYATFKEFSRLANEENHRASTLRGLFDLKTLPRPIPLEEVEPASEIVKRFSTGAMSFGSISKEAHETLAIAMNRMGGKSNTGEGGEDPERFSTEKNSAIKQVASARFGVTTEYLVNARELQIKMAQGAKPGEGGQLPGHKVDDVIGRIRHATPGVTLISPPPHHDIYSIEDLAQLIYDLKNVNPEARITVKLVAEVGVGTGAAGVAKAHADMILISGDSGGTGASPLSSIKYAGEPWELGLAETQQTLVLNDLRGRVRIQTDGQLKTGRDVIVAALLGAEEFGFATAPLIVEGCIMMRKCHLNTCPVGIATQDPLLRKKFTGQPEHIINYFFFIAEEIREYMSKLGFRKFDDMVGRVDLLEQKKAIDHWKGRGIDLSKLLYRPKVSSDIPVRCVGRQDHGLEGALDHTLIKLAGPALEKQSPVAHALPIRNVHRTVGAMLSGMITKKYGSKGLPPGTIRFTFTGTAGQSFGAFLVNGVSLTLIGESNDYLGKGMSGGEIVVFPPPGSLFKPDETIIVGNTLLYGATGGEIFIHGLAGERFAVRNSGARTVVDGVGDHGCEYMTGGVVVVLGRTGRNFAAGMSGGVAFVYDEERDFRKKCNLSLVELETVVQPEDKTTLRSLVEKHAEKTGSARSGRLLNEWDASLEKFIKVIPVEYRQILESRQAAVPAKETSLHG